MRILFFIHVFVLIQVSIFAQDVIPIPALSKYSGKHIDLSDGISVEFDNEDTFHAEYLKNYLQKYTSVRVVNSDKSSLKLVFLKNKDIEANGFYTLTVAPDKIQIGGDPSGRFYAIQTLIQLMEEKNGKTVLREAQIVDRPLFSWRGMHLDVSRHFFPVSFIKKYLDYMAFYKMNVFHWHLTDDQGWRIEIKKYPKLVEIGSKRKETIVDKNFSPYKGDGKPYAGFYTQDDIREVVRYASERHITVVPEIEMPGHSMALLAAYPGLACTPGPFETGTKWGVYEDVLCPTENTFSFLQDVLDEVMQLFPSKYIHIGGDECPKKRWKNSAFCQKLMKENKLKNEDELQSYFIRRIEKYLSSKGRKLIGWDEILEGGLAPGAAVMSWRGEEGGIAAANAGHEAVMSPGSHCYFDHYQSNASGEPLAIGGYTPLEKVYSYDPVPKDLAEEKTKYIIGAQANVWTEYMADGNQVEYMIFPRICAMAEVVWTQKKLKNYEDFSQRILSHFKRFDRWGNNYARTFFEVTFHSEPSKDGKSLLVRLKSQDPNAIPEYRILPDTVWTGYVKPLMIEKACTIEARRKGFSATSSLTLHRSKFTGIDITLTNPPDKRYSDGGEGGLVNGIKAGSQLKGGLWSGWFGETMQAVLDLGKIEKMQEVVLGVMRAEPSWIYLPESVMLEVSDDGKSYRKVTMLSKEDIYKIYGNNDGRMDIRLSAETTGRYIRITAEPLRSIPDGNEGAGHKAWLFIDEIEGY